MVCGSTRLSPRGSHCDIVAESELSWWHTLSAKLFVILVNSTVFCFLSLLVLLNLHLFFFSLNEPRNRGLEPTFANRKLNDRRGVVSCLLCTAFQVSVKLPYMIMCFLCRFLCTGARGQNPTRQRKLVKLFYLYDCISSCTLTKKKCENDAKMDSDFHIYLSIFDLYIGRVDSCLKKIIKFLARSAKVMHQCQSLQSFYFKQRIL